MTVFVRAIGSANPDRVLRAAANYTASERRWLRSQQQLHSIPGSPFAYWAQDSVLSAFREFQPYETRGRTALQGASTCDDFRYVRTWYEPAPAPSQSGAGRSWVGFARGGAASRYYQRTLAVVPWDSARTSFLGFIGRPGRWNPKPVSADHYFAPALTWPLRGISFTASALPAGCAYSVGGKVALAGTQELPVLLAVFNSSAFRACMGVFAGKAGGFQYETGVINATPVPALDSSSSTRLADLGLRGWSLTHGLDSCYEVSHAFVVPAVLQIGGVSFGDRVGEWSSRVSEAERELDEVQSEIDALCFELYRISDEDRAAITEGFGVTGSSEKEGSDDDVGDDAEPVGADPSVLAAGLVSWAVGVGVGRFDVRLATGGREWPTEPDPFDPLPVCSPAMLTGEDGLPVNGTPLGYPVSVSPVLVDDRGHELDIIGSVRAVFDVVFGADADSWWADAGEALGARHGEISSWLQKGFFDHHLRSHSKSRRKAPILWPIGTASGSYAVWLYAHRVTADSLFQVLNDFVDPKLRAEQRHLTELTREAGPNPSAGQREALDAQETLVGELRELRDELGAVTPLWAPDLNDGIVIVLAPLWRLFAHHRPWSRELKKHWDRLAAGDYDWAQLAMHLWPERVIPKCAEDRSIAIAHGLEDVFWAHDPNSADKWHSRTTPTIPIDQLIAERHQPETKAALQQATP